MLFKLALRNVLRQRVRTGMTLGAVVFGVAVLILAGGFIQDIFVQLGEAIIHSQTGHIQVFKRDFLEKGTRAPERYLIDEPEALMSALEHQPGVEAVMGRLFFAGVMNNGRRDLPIIGEGVEPDKEARLGSFIQITAGRQLAKDDQDGILLGQGVAHNLGLAPGDRATLLVNTGDGAMNSLDFQVIGVFQSFSKDFDARAVRIPLGAAQELLATPGINQIVMALHKTEDTDAAYQATTAQVGAALEVRHWRNLSDFYDKAVQLYDRQFGFLRLIVLMMVLLSVTNSVNMSVFERQGEFGTMQAMGNPRRQVARLILAESLIIGAAGAILGMALGLLGAALLSAIGIPMPPPPNANVGYIATIRPNVWIVVSSGMVGLASTLGAAVIPASRISRIPVVDALRQNI
ncbi:MAG: ABC transporter permease [Rhodocyclaceae bacterium]|jgi:putative ABC transport system permease protein|nr:ABC transporter permease [Rhodocyclaceae bacterium]